MGAPHRAFFRTLYRALDGAFFKLFLGLFQVTGLVIGLFVITLLELVLVERTVWRAAASILYFLRKPARNDVTMWDEKET